MKQNANQEKFELDIATIDLPLQVYEFSGEEKLGEDYYFDITFICEDPDVDLAAWLQLPARLSLHHNNDKTPRYVHGIIEFIEQLATSFRYSTYKLKLTPIFNLLSYRTHFRIFQKQTIPDIITAVYQDAGIQNNHFSMELFSPHLSREYCVQYGETDHAFIKRLMAEEGLVSFFEHLEVNST
ncbi:type VI secretion system tip protein VgrG [Aliivibrio salmonicida]